eukprot:TRINITY_DN40653_c0_g1_i1.p1 TRINITY_DN40653_c0_g1~~TRINITY_DN40653_c0_g1_i1.p1  ORF type:complete len:411 (-),score=86.52 TRINITY_DN40653_c0_g1_i1:89-1321(-)
MRTAESSSSDSSLAPSEDISVTRQKHRHRVRRRTSSRQSSVTSTTSKLPVRPQTAVPRPGLLDKFIDNRYNDEDFDDDGSEFGTSLYSRASSRRSSRLSSRASSRRGSEAGSQLSAYSQQRMRPHTSHANRSRMQSRMSRPGTQARPRTAFGTTLSSYGLRSDDRFREKRGAMSVDYTKPITLDEFGAIDAVVRDQVDADQLKTAEIPQIDMNPDKVTLEAPAARRAQLNQILDQQERAREVRSRLGQRARAAEVMRQSSRYPQGFLGDSSLQGKGEFRDKHSIFAGKAQAILQQRNQHENDAHRRRRSLLDHKQKDVIKDFLTDDKVPALENTKRAKGQGIQRDNGNLFHNMLLPAPQPRNAEARKTAIRNQDSNGRGYDVITNVVTKYYPPSIDEKKEPKKLHPSLFT